MIGFYLYGAVEPLTGDGCFLELPRLTGECFQIFIDELFSDFFPTALILSFSIMDAFIMPSRW